MKAIISDVHANQEALGSVCGDMQEHNVDDIICLGDIVGYGPDPEACIDQVMSQARVVLMGNHDYALINGPLGFNPMAADMIRMTREMMESSKENEAGRDTTDCFEPHFFTCAHQGQSPKCLLMAHTAGARWDFIEELPTQHKDGDILYVHGSPLDPTFEYVFPPKFLSGWNPARLELLFKAVSRIAFCGHTHHPCAITSKKECIYPDECNYRLALDPDEKYIINAGSVGQPRDGDNRASYLLFDEKANTIEWRRIPYDIETVVEKSAKMCGERNWCGERLRHGR